MKKTDVMFSASEEYIYSPISKGINLIFNDQRMLPSAVVGGESGGGDVTLLMLTIEQSRPVWAI
jgi:hypothetical protein